MYILLWPLEGQKGELNQKGGIVIKISPFNKPSLTLSSLICILVVGIVFNNLENNDLEYTLRLRHEVGEDQSWETRDATPNFQTPGPRISNK